MFHSIGLAAGIVGFLFVCASIYFDSRKDARKSDMATLGFYLCMIAVVSITYSVDWVKALGIFGFGMFAIRKFLKLRQEYSEAPPT